MESLSVNETIYPGKHPDVINKISNLFSKQEREIIDMFAREWYITSADQVATSGSSYQYFSMRSTAKYEEILGLSKEIIVIFSEYPRCEPRTLSVFNIVEKKYTPSRIEKICYILISEDVNVGSIIKAYQGAQDEQIIVPFCFKEFIDAKKDPHFLRNKFRRCFYSRDLFGYTDPLKNDFYFFGRHDLVLEAIDKHKSHQNFGLFGLRKTGKTSIIYDIIRKIDKEESIGIYIDCESTSLTHRRWNHALFYVINVIEEAVDYKISGISEDGFSESRAGELFEKYIKEISASIGRNILLLFDEIENITFNKSGVLHWRNELDFVFFWQSIRSAFQQTRDVFSYCILGTNPSCIEMPTITTQTISNVDNPIFSSFQYKYIDGFNLDQTRDMVRTLGRFMGIKFGDTIYSKLLEEYGGHPFLIRCVCSEIAKENSDRPVTIDRYKYELARDKFNSSDTKYFGMLLEVLKQYYPLEYDMLKLLSKNDIETFLYFAQEDNSLTNHLIGYGIINNIDGRFDFKIDALKKFILRKEKIIEHFSSSVDKWRKICELRNITERRLRDMTRKTIRVAMQTESAAKHTVTSILSSKRDAYSSYTYSELFDPKKTNIYLKDLQKLILSHWDFFKSYWADQSMFINCMDILNKEGRFDAHAKEPDDKEMTIINAAVEKISDGISAFEENFN